MHMVERHRAFFNDKRFCIRRILNFVRQFHDVEHLGRIGKRVIELAHIIPDLPNTIHEPENIDLDEHKITYRYKTSLPEQYRTRKKRKLYHKSKEPLHAEDPQIGIPYML